MIVSEGIDPATAVAKYLANIWPNGSRRVKLQNGSIHSTDQTEYPNLLACTKIDHLLGRNQLSAIVSRAISKAIPNERLA